MIESETMKQHIRPAASEEELISCAKLMAESEPWITLGRGFEQTRKAVHDASSDLFISLAGEEFTGFIMVQMQGAFRGYIKSFGIMPSWRGRGIGTSLLSFAESYIFAATPNVFLCVSSFNTSAQGFYTAHGYEIIGELKDYIIEGYSEILMRKSVGPLSGYRGSRG
ncbi:GNAT family N-acetyltransferase [Sediminispirochaeta bajacaliforniensis]|uniref:GNAT family N-acetyltransferase n=1 Tax=Sediminispirochaeta bajacaliforniensis TaxID=148 RepID=UPI00037C9830|nr:N-acetyltransferase [Sediminispirochaeta bajacaliforniensis]